MMIHCTKCLTGCTDRQHVTMNSDPTTDTWFMCICIVLYAK